MTATGTQQTQVLVCDDDENFSDFLCALLRGEGWGADAVASGEECLARIEGEALPDVLVLDHRMPGLLGLEVAARLRQQGFDRPILLCSAYLDASHRSEIARLGLMQVNKIDTQALVRHVAASLAADPLPQRAPARTPARTRRS
jgi:CheY-like chemotaxis protein